MPVTWDIDGRIVALRMIDTYEVTDIKAGLRAALDDPRATGAVGLLFDVTMSKSLSQRQPRDVETVGYFLAEEADRFNRRIALIGGEDFKYGMMRIGSVILERLKITNSVFRREEEAREWLLSSDA